MADFLGASFGFGAMDVGFKAAMSSAIKSVGEISKGINGQLKDGKKLSRMWQGVKSSVDSFNIASIASNMNELNGNTGNLSNSLESMGVSMAQAAKPIIAGMDLTSKEARKMTGRVTGMAIGLNVGAEQVAETLRAIHSAGGPAKAAIDAMAMSERDWVKVTTTTGVTMQDFSAVLGDMTASWGASPKQAAAMIDNIMAIGKQAGIGEHGIKGMKGQLDALDDIFEGMPPGIARTADEVQSLMESTYKLSGVFRTMGDTQEDATARGQDTAKMFAEQATLIETLYAVGGDQNLDESPLFRFLTQLGIGTEEAKSIIIDGSKDVVGGVSRINDVFAKMGGDSSPQVGAALGELSKAMGASASGLGFLASSTTVGRDRLKEMAEMTVRGEGALRRYGKSAHSSGRTLQESMDLAREGFETQFRAIGRADVRGFAKKQMKAYKSMGKELKQLGGDPVWGGFIKKMSIMHQMGAKGVFESFADDLDVSSQRARELSVGFELAMNTAKQLSSEFAPVMEIMGMLGPAGGLAIAGGIASYFVLSESDRKEIFGSFYPVIDKIGNAIKDLWNKIPWDKIKIGFEAVMDKISLYFARLFERIMGKDFAEKFGLTKSIKAMEREQAVKTQADRIRKEDAAKAARGTVFGGQSVPLADWERKSDFEIGKEAEKTIRIGEMREDVKKYSARTSSRDFARSAAEAAAKAKGASADEQRAQGQLEVDRMMLLEEAQSILKDTSGMNIIPWVREFRAGRAVTQAENIGGMGDLSRSTQKETEKRLASEGEARRAHFRRKKDPAEAVPGIADELADSVDTEALQEKAKVGGTAVLGSWGAGVKEGTPDALTEIYGAMGILAKPFGGSLPEDGPLKDGERSFNGGRSVMESFANGMYEAKDFVADTVAMVLDDAVIGTLDTYATKMEELAAGKSLLKGVARKMVQDMGGDVKMGSVEIDGVNLDAEQTFEAAMSLPGLASVVAAIASDGHKTRVVLKKIQEDTSGILAMGNASPGAGSSAGQPTLE